MSKIECELRGDFNAILNSIDGSVMNGHVSASREDSSTFQTDSCLCAVRVYERYSLLGDNRVSLNITLLKTGGRIYLSAISSGGSQAVLFKINTFGEDAFLDCIRNAIKAYIV